MRTLEKTFWGLVRKHLPTGCDAQRIETGSTGLGIPDVNLCFKGQEIWIELKVVQGYKIDISPQQVAWHFRRWRAGGTTYIMARDKVDGVRKGKFDRIHIWPGQRAPEILEYGVHAEGGFVFTTPFDWDAIVGLIFRSKD